MEKVNKQFGGTEATVTGRDEAAIYLQSIPYDGTSTWGKGADEGFRAFIEASENMELYDIETDSEVYRRGIFTLDELSGFKSPEEMFDTLYQSTRQLLKENKFLTFFGGEHSISIALIKAFYEHFSGLTVVQIDAHADLRPEYHGSKYNHACAVYDASRHCNLVQIGIRSMEAEEKQYVQPGNCFYAHEMAESETWQRMALAKMTDTVYITLDLDALDPSIMPATGTPEPGGMQWYETLTLLRKIFEEKNVVGFDIVELAPVRDLHAPQFLVSKLYYKMLSYKFSE